MLDCIEAWRHRHERRAVIAGKSIVAVALIAGCSWVPDAVNPVEWYKGVSDAFSSSDAPEIAAPRRPEGSFPDVNADAKAKQQQQQQAKGLAADRDNAKYAESVKREPNPTKQLARRTPAPGQTQVAQAPTGDQKFRHARDEGPNAPPSTAPAGGPPARADIPDQVPTRRSLLTEHYAKRLAESHSATNKNDPFATVPPARPESFYNQPVHTYAVPAVSQVAYRSGESDMPALVPPKGVKGLRGAKGAVVPSGPSASFQVASLQFGADGGLTASDRASLQDVARLQKQTGGTVRVLGRSYGAISFVGDEEAVAGKRAAAVAKALTGMGVPARKVLLAADTSSGGYDDSGARVSIEY